MFRFEKNKGAIPFYLQPERNRKCLELQDLDVIKGHKIVHLNIRSLMNKVDLIRHLLVNNGIVCLCLSETWLRDLIYIDGYKVHRADRLRGSLNLIIQGDI